MNHTARPSNRISRGAHASFRPYALGSVGAFACQLEGAGRAVHGERSAFSVQPSLCSVNPLLRGVGIMGHIRDGNSVTQRTLPTRLKNIDTATLLPPWSAPIGGR
jgi:hypothetical protein